MNSPWNAGRKLEIRLDRERYIAGETIRAIVCLTAEREFAVRGGTVELLCTHRYSYDLAHNAELEIISRIATGTINDIYLKPLSDTTAPTRTATDRKTFATLAFIDGPRRLTSGTHTFPLELRLPWQAIPSHAATLTEADWLMRARLDIPHARDLATSGPLVVVRAERAGAAQGGEPVPPQPDECALALDPPFGTVHAGERCAGTLAIRAGRPLRIRHVRLALLRHQRVSAPALTGQERDVQDTHGMVVTQLADETMLERGEERAFPFDLTVPAESCPSFDSDRAHVWWTWHAVVVTESRNYTLDQPVQLFG